MRILPRLKRTYICGIIDNGTSNTIYAVPGKEVSFVADSV
jgi:hypothetical protein